MYFDQGGWGCPLSEYNSAAEEIPASTTVVWMQESEFFAFKGFLKVVYKKKK